MPGIAVQPGRKSHAPCAWLLLCCLLVWGTVVQAGGATLDVRIVVDVSASMKRADPGNQRVSSLRGIIERLPEGSSAGVWTFGRFVNMLVPHSGVDAGWRDEAARALEGIGSIAVHRNIEAAMETASWNWHVPTAAFDRHLILITDGGVNMPGGAAANEASHGRIAQQVLPRLQRAGVEIHTVALSEAADASLLRQMSAATNGRFSQANNADALEGILLGVFEGAIQPVATAAVPAEPPRQPRRQAALDELRAPSPVVPETTSVEAAEAPSIEASHADSAASSAESTDASTSTSPGPSIDGTASESPTALATAPSPSQLVPVDERPSPVTAAEATPPGGPNWTRIGLSVMAVNLLLGAGLFFAWRRLNRGERPVVAVAAIGNEPAGALVKEAPGPQAAKGADTEEVKTETPASTLVDDEAQDAAVMAGLTEETQADAVEESSEAQTLPTETTQTATTEPKPVDEAETDAGEPNAPQTAVAALRGDKQPSEGMDLIGRAVEKRGPKEPPARPAAVAEDLDEPILGINVDEIELDFEDRPRHTA